VSGNELRAILIGSLKERILDTEFEAQIQMYRELYVEELCIELHPSHLDRLEYFKKGIKLCERLSESIRDGYESLLVDLVQGRLSPDYVKEVLVRRDHSSMKSAEGMKTLLEEQREAKRKRLRIIKSDE
jgi:hypothetical protein